MTFVLRMAVMHLGHHLLAAPVAFSHLLLTHSHVAHVTHGSLALHLLVLGMGRRGIRRRGLSGGKSRSHQDNHSASPEFECLASKLRPAWEAG
jgi:hypothetical protein